jgi:hypothetical protein
MTQRPPAPGKVFQISGIDGDFKPAAQRASERHQLWWKVVVLGENCPPVDVD